MAGLLYKDFVGIKGRNIIWLFLGMTVVFLALRFLFPGDAETEIVGMMENGAGELVNLTIGELSDSVLMLLPVIAIICSLVAPSVWRIMICKNDEKNKTRQWIRSLPLEKDAYIASKYIFIGIAVYILFALENIWIVIFNSRAGQGVGSQILSAFSYVLPALSGACLLLASVELPFFLTLGEKKGSFVKTALLELLALLVIVYIFFGDIKAIQNWDIFAFLKWWEAHSLMMTVISMILPVVALFLYYLSYRLTCKLNQNREVEIDE